MGKRKRPRRGPNNRKPDSPKQSSLWGLERWIGIVSLVLGLAGLILNYIPKLSVSVAGSLQSVNPMASVFALSNDGLLPVRDLFVVCGTPQLDAGQYKFQSGPGGGFIFPDSRAEVLSPGHTMALPCGHIFGVADPSSITKAEITIVVRYRPDFLFWHKTANFNWKAEKTLDGTWIWKSTPS